MIAVEDAPLLKAWIVDRAAKVSDAEPDVLAEYILALLNNRVEGDELVKLLSGELAVLVTDHDAFAREIVGAVATKAYAQASSLEEVRQQAQRQAIALTSQYFKPDLTSFNQAPPDYKRSRRQLATATATAIANVPATAAGGAVFNKPVSVAALGGKLTVAQETQQRQRRMEGLVSTDHVPLATHIIVAQLPVETLDEVKIRAFFTKFGAINTVTVDPALRMAEVGFEDPAGAKKAWSSPAPIFDNRFVKVFYRKKDSETQRPVPELEKPFDVEAFKQQQVAKQREFEEKQIKLKAHNEKLQQLIDLKQKMLDSFVTELETLENELRSNPEREDEIRSRVEQIKTRMTDENITPESIAQDRMKLSRGPQQAARARGGGGFRGRGSIRGAGRGRGGRGGFTPYQRPQGPYNRKLDLRTRTLTILNLSDPNNESLQRALGVIGSEYVSEVSKKGEDGVNVTFTDRYYADKFLNDKVELENMPPLQMQWDESVRSQITDENRLESPADTEMS